MLFSLFLPCSSHPYVPKVLNHPHSLGQLPSISTHNIFEHLAALLLRHVYMDDVRKRWVLRTGSPFCLFDCEIRKMRSRACADFLTMKGAPFRVSKNAASLSRRNYLSRHCNGPPSSTQAQEGSISPPPHPTQHTPQSQHFNTKSSLFPYSLHPLPLYSFFFLPLLPGAPTGSLILLDPDSSGPGSPSSKSGSL